jgi:hypothetical protein
MSEMTPFTLVVNGTTLRAESRTDYLVIADALDDAGRHSEADDLRLMAECDGTDSGHIPVVIDGKLSSLQALYDDLRISCDVEVCHTDAEGRCWADRRTITVDACDHGACDVDEWTQEEIDEWRVWLARMHAAECDLADLRHVPGLTVEQALSDAGVADADWEDQPGAAERAIAALRSAAGGAD